MECATALRRLRASNQVEEDIEEMRAEERAQQAEATISMMELICSPTLRSPLIIGVVMQLSQQLSGINAVSLMSLYAMKNYFVLYFIGVLLFDKSIYKFGSHRGKCQVCDNRHWCYYGWYDVSVHTTYG